VDLTDAPPANACSHFYRIAREAVVNVTKHARARAIDIEVARRGSEVVLVVRDDGVGIPVPTPDGMGLHMMESRAKMLGAELEVSAGARGGTIVTCKMSLSA
jgi:signal transduction histidine kinase